MLEFIYIVEWKDERTMLFDSVRVNNFNQSELIVYLLLMF